MDVALVLEFHQDGFHDIAGFLISENAGAGSSIEPFLDPLGEAAAELEFLFLRPWLRVLFEEDFAVLAPFGEFGMRKGIAEAEGDELHHAVLLPVGEPRSVLLDFFGWIEEIGHRGI